MMHKASKSTARALWMALSNCMANSVAYTPDCLTSASKPGAANGICSTFRRTTPSLGLRVDRGAVDQMHMRNPPDALCISVRMFLDRLLYWLEDEHVASNLFLVPFKLLLTSHQISQNA